MIQFRKVCIIMKKVYEAPEFLSEDVLDDMDSNYDNTTPDTFSDDGDEEATSFVLG